MNDNIKIYFDYNATAPLLYPVKQAMLEVMDNPLNASSVHSFGRYAKSLLESARIKVQNSVKASSQKYNVIFTSSGTEANNLALKGFINNYQPITSCIEHQSVLKVVGEGIIPVDRNGVIDLLAVKKILNDSNRKYLVSVMLANNETGVIQPIKELADIVHYYKGLIHTDAVQAVGKIDLNIDELQADMITISAHKVGGPIGAAALIIRKDLAITPLIIGGGQEYMLRAGTQNIPAIHGFGIACDIAGSQVTEMQKITKLRDFIEDSILKFCSQAIIFSKDSSRLPNTTSIGMPNVRAETQVIYFDTKHIAVSAGSACSSGKVNLPYVQMAMGFPENIANTAIRISLGISNTIAEIQYFIKTWQNLYNHTDQIKLKIA